GSRNPAPRARAPEDQAGSCTTVPASPVTRNHSESWISRSPASKVGSHRTSALEHDTTFRPTAAISVGPIRSYDESPGHGGRFSVPLGNRNRKRQESTRRHTIEHSLPAPPERRKSAPATGVRKGRTTRRQLPWNAAVPSMIRPAAAS